MTELYKYEPGLSLGEQLELVMKEFGKMIPVAGAVVGTLAAIEQKEQMNRLGRLVEDVANRMEDRERREGLSERGAELMLLAAGFVRGDPMADAKAATYGSAVVGLMRKSADPQVCIEIMENLRKVMPDDLVILRRFKTAKATALPFDLVADIQPNYPFDGADRLARERLEETHPRVIRLESFGLLYRIDGFHPTNLGKGLGPLAAELRKSVKLTPPGQRLLDFIPAE